jgi:hypothetical protein
MKPLLVILFHCFDYASNHGKVIRHFLCKPDATKADIADMLWTHLVETKDDFLDDVYGGAEGEVLVIKDSGDLAAYSNALAEYAMQYTFGNGDFDFDALGSEILFQMNGYCHDAWEDGELKEYFENILHYS